VAGNEWLDVMLGLGTKAGFAFGLVVGLSASLVPRQYARRVVVLGSAICSLLFIGYLLHLLASSAAA
jgi:hypothetical protein